MSNLTNNSVLNTVIRVLLVICVILIFLITSSVSVGGQNEVRVKYRDTIVQIWDLSASGVHMVDVYLNGQVVGTNLTVSENARIYLHTLRLRLSPGRNILTVRVKRATNLALNLPVRFPDYKYGSPCDVRVHIETRGSREGSIVVWAP